MTNGGYNTQYDVHYDGDGMPDYTVTDGITTDYGRDTDERVISENFLDPSQNSYGNLSYAYDADGEVIDKGGSLAAINLPSPSTATYDANDQLLEWNNYCVSSGGKCATSDATSNIINDPASNYSLTWTSRNQVSSMTTATNLSDAYDAGGSRDTESTYPYFGGAGSGCSTIPCTESLNFLHDGSSIAGWEESLTGYQYQTVVGQWDFLSAGGGALAGSYTDAASQTTTNYVPLVDAAGTVIALVNPASAGTPAETVTYDPSGTPSASGSANGWPFLYHGMEQEGDPSQYYYSGNGAYHSAQIMRSMSMTGAQGTSGPPGGPGPGPASLPGVPSSGSDLSNLDFGVNPAFTGGGAALGSQLAPETVQEIDQELGTALTGAQIGGGVGAAIAAAYDLAGLFYDVFSGGSPDYPPNYFTFQHRLDRPHGGPHPLYTEFIGISPDLAVNQQGSAPSSSQAGKGSPQRPLPKPCEGGCTSAPPLPSNSLACNSYGGETYLGVSEKCFCKCAGNSPWAQQVRGCLACEHAAGANPYAAHEQCYGAAGLASAPWGTLSSCYRQCFRGF